MTAALKPGLAALLLLLAMGSASPVRANYEISGIVGTPEYERLPGVVVKLSGATTREDTTGEDGAYSFKWLPAGDYTVTPVLENWAFDPPSRTYTGLSADQLEQHYFGTQVGFSVSGLVYSSFGAPIQGVAMVLSGDADLTDTTNAGGIYGFAGLPAGDYEVTPTRKGYTFNPASKSYAPLARDMTSQNFSGSPLGGSARVVGGENGYVDAARGEKATVLITPSVAGSVRLIIYTLRGEKVWGGSLEVEADKENSFEWDCRNQAGQLVAPGVYVIDLDGASITQTARIAVVR
jgi:hypothetical protein